MGMIFKYKIDNETKDLSYYAKTKLSNNQTAYIEFQEYEYSNSYIYNVHFVINSKKNKLDADICYNKETGTCGLEGLLWAKEMIKEFEKYILNNVVPYHNKYKFFIEVCWNDNRRRNVYERGLKSLGYKITYDREYKSLSKLIA